MSIQYLVDPPLFLSIYLILLGILSTNFLRVSSIILAYSCLKATSISIIDLILCLHVEIASFNYFQRFLIRDRLDDYSG